MRAWLASIIVLVQVLPAHADATEDAAQVHLDRGVAAFEANDFALARRELGAARDLAPNKPNPYRWLALTDIQLGDCTAALPNIEGFVTRAPARDPRIAELVRLRELCQRAGVLRVTSSPSPVSLRVDGAAVGSTPYQALSMRAGSHVVAAERRGFVGVTRSIVITPGEAVELRLDLAPARTPITRRWWFWAAVGTALTTAGIVVFVASDDDSPTLLPPVQCGVAGCRPGSS